MFLLPRKVSVGGETVNTQAVLILGPKNQFVKPSHFSSQRSSSQFCNGFRSDLLDELKAFLEQDDYYVVLGWGARRVHDKAEQAWKRLRGLVKCYGVGHLSYGVLKGPDGFGDYVVKFHPFQCRSIFCPRCWGERVRKNDMRLWFFFERLREMGVERVVFLTLTVPHSGFEVEVVDRVREVWRRFYRMRLSKRVVARVRERVQEIMREHYESLLAKGVRESEARRRVEVLLSDAERFLSEGAGKLVKDVLGAGVKVLEVVVKGAGDSLSVHPHLHACLLGYVSLYAVRALWEMAGGGSILYVEEVRSLNRIRRYLQSYLGKGYLDVEARLTLEHAIELEAMLHGVHFVEVFGFGRYRRDEEELEEVREYRYYMVDLLLGDFRVVERCEDRLRVEFEGMVYDFVKHECGYLCFSQELVERVRKRCLLREAKWGH